MGFWCYPRAKIDNKMQIYSPCNQRLTRHFKTMEALYSCHILVRNHQQCTPVSPKLLCGPGMNDFELNSPIITLQQRLLMDCWNYHVMLKFLICSDFTLHFWCSRCVVTPNEGETPVQRSHGLSTESWALTAHVESLPANNWFAISNNW